MKIAVVCGGDNSEREVSLQSGEFVQKSLLAGQIKADLIDLKSPKQLNKLLNYDKIFNVLHGGFGENGQLQAFLEFYKIKYTGANFTASAIAFNKFFTKAIWKSKNLPVAKDILFSPSADLKSSIKTFILETKKDLKDLGTSLIIKPNSDGSSVGLSRLDNFVGDYDTLYLAIEKAAQFGDVLIEEAIGGEKPREFTLPYIRGFDLPIIEIKPKGKVYDYEAKYITDSTQLFIPCDINAEKTLQIKNLCKNALEILSVQDWGRIDFMFNEKDEPVLLEVNTNPGMTSHSLVPFAAKSIGLTSFELVNHIINL